MNQENIWCLILHNKVRGQEKNTYTKGIVKRSPWTYGRI